jgi:hypothetical protein
LFSFWFLLSFLIINEGLEGFPHPRILYIHCGDFIIVFTYL